MDQLSRVSQCALLLRFRPSTVNRSQFPRYMHSTSKDAAEDFFESVDLSRCSGSQEAGFLEVAAVVVYRFAVV